MTTAIQGHAVREGDLLVHGSALADATALKPFVALARERTA